MIDDLFVFFVSFFNRRESSKQQQLIDTIIEQIFCGFVPFHGV